MKKRRCISLTPAADALLRQLAAQHGLSVTAMIEVMVRDRVKQEAGK